MPDPNEDVEKPLVEKPSRIEIVDRLSENLRFQSAKEEAIRMGSLRPAEVPANETGGIKRPNIDKTMKDLNMTMVALQKTIAGLTSAVVGDAEAGAVNGMGRGRDPQVSDKVGFARLAEIAKNFGKSAVAFERKPGGISNMAGDVGSLFQSGQNLTLQGILSGAGRIGKTALRGGYGRTAKIGAAVLGTQSILPTLSTGMGRLEDLYQRRIGAGINAGLSYGMDGSQGVMAGIGGMWNSLVQPLGLLGISPPFMGGEANRFAFRDQLDSFMASFNPFDSLSARDDAKIKALVRSSGYRVGSERERQVIDVMRDLKKQGQDPELAIEYINLFAKKMDESAEVAGKELLSFRDRAQAAGKSLDDYTRQMIEVTKTLTSRGVSATESKAAARVAGMIPNVSASDLMSIGEGMSPAMMLLAQEQYPEIFSDSAAMSAFIQNPQAVLGGESAMMSKDIVDFFMKMSEERLGPNENRAVIATNAIGLAGGALGGQENVQTVLNIADTPREQMEAMQNFAELSEEQKALEERRFGGGFDDFLEKYLLEAGFPAGIATGARSILTAKAEDKAMAEYASLTEDWIKDSRGSLFESVKGLGLDEDQLEEIKKKLYDPTKNISDISNEIEEMLRKKGVLDEKEDEIKLSINASDKLKEFFEFEATLKSSGYDKSKPLVRQMLERNRANSGQDKTTP